MKFPSANCAEATVDRYSGQRLNMKKPNVRGPSPARKAHLVLRGKLNRKSKPVPALPFATASRNHCSARIPAGLFMEKIDGLAGLTNKITARLATKPEIFIIHPAELLILRSMSDQDLRALAAENGWRMVRRLGGRQIEFYNDASAREST